MTFIIFNIICLKMWSFDMQVHEDRHHRLHWYLVCYRSMTGLVVKVLGLQALVHIVSIPFCFTFNHTFIIIIEGFPLHLHRSLPPMISLLLSSASWGPCIPTMLWRSSISPCSTSTNFQYRKCGNSKVSDEVSD